MKYILVATGVVSALILALAYILPGTAARLRQRPLHRDGRGVRRTDRQEPAAVGCHVPLRRRLGGEVSPSAMTPSRAELIVQSYQRGNDVRSILNNWQISGSTLTMLLRRAHVPGRDTNRRNWKRELDRKRQGRLAMRIARACP